MKTTYFDTPLAERLGRARPIGRGLLVCVTIALATTFIADHYGGPTLLYALLFGMSLHFLSEEGAAARASSSPPAPCCASAWPCWGRA